MNEEQMAGAPKNSMTQHMMSSWLITGFKIRTISLGFIVLAILSISSINALCQPSYSLENSTIAYKNLSIDLGYGLKTDAQLTMPAIAAAKESSSLQAFPGVLLIQDSGPMDMNGYQAPEITGSKPVMPLLQMAEYLSKRGFIVLRYNKRSIGLGGLVMNRSIAENTTAQQLIGDAEQAYGLLKNQSEVNPDDITLIGYGEGTVIAAEVAQRNPSIDKVVLLSPLAHNLRDILYFQMVTRPLLYAEEVIDANQDGKLSIQESAAQIGLKNESMAPLQVRGLIENSTGRYRWYLGLDADGNGLLSIQNELKPILISQFDLVTTSPKSPEYPWTASYLALGENSAIVANLSASILILQGENDIQVPLMESLTMEQRLISLKHPDHTLITYPGLGHLFNPAEGWVQVMGPMQSQALSDIHSWLKSPVKEIGHPVPQKTAQSNELNDWLEWIWQQIQPFLPKISWSI